MTKRRKLLYGLLIAVVVNALLFVLAEWVCGMALRAAKRKPEFPARLAPDVRTRDRGVETSADPYLLFRVKPGLAAGHVETNRFGIRGAEITPRPEPGVIRVLFLGGSVAWGYEANVAAEAIPALLEERLQARASELGLPAGTRFEVLNAGVPSYVAWQEALAYATFLREVAPHVIVTLDGVNDVAAALTTRQAGWPMNFSATKSRYVDESRSLGSLLAAWLEGTLADSRMVALWKEKHPLPLRELALPPAAAVATQERDAMIVLTDLARADGALVLSVLQPALPVGDDKPLAEFETAYLDWYEGRTPGISAYYRECYAALRSELARIGGERPGFHFVDASGVFAGMHELAYCDHCHLTLAGRRRLVEAICDRFAAGLLGELAVARRQ